MSALAERLVRQWVALYTRGLPTDVRDTRRGEIESDLWSHREDARESGQSAAARSIEIVTRLVLGIPADIGWRLEQQGRASDRKPIERSATMGSRIVALVAIFGGAAMCIVMVWYSTVPLAPGAPSWRVFQEPNLGATMSTLGWLGMFALVGATGGLVYLFIDGLEPVAAILAALGVGGGVFGLMGAYPALLLFPLGSAALLLGLARIHAVSWWLAVTHMAGGVMFVTALWAALGDHSARFSVPLFTVYPLTWIAIGLVVLRGFSRAAVEPRPSG